MLLSSSCCLSASDQLAASTTGMVSSLSSSDWGLFAVLLDVGLDGGHAHLVIVGRVQGRSGRRGVQAVLAPALG